MDVQVGQVVVHVTGGGRGWTARVAHEGQDIIRKGESKQGAIDAAMAEYDLAEAIGHPGGDGAEPKVANLCLCGCGGTTQRRFVPGHDARYHARQKLEARAKAAGVTVEEAIALDRARRREEAAAKSRERRARAKQPNGRR